MIGWCFNVSFPFIRNSFSNFRDFYFQFLVLLVYNIQPQISLLESGKYQVKRKAAEKLAAALEVGVDWLLTGDEEKKDFPADKAMVDWLWQHPEVREELWERMKE